MKFHLSEGLVRLKQLNDMLGLAHLGDGVTERQAQSEPQAPAAKRPGGCSTQGPHRH